ncbi:hypothetical protein THAOC_25937, partial [Thalassiosira oceanica]
KDWKNDNVKSYEKSTLRAPLKVCEASKKKKAKTKTTDQKAPKPAVAPKVTPEIVAESAIIAEEKLSENPAEEKLSEDGVPETQPQLHIDFDNLEPPAKRIKTA